MKLRRVRLQNVRRFDAPVEVAGIADGLNVLAAPNERGKSTLFDAVQAVFFAPHRSRAQTIKALQPHAGGGPEVAVEVETSHGLFRIEKRWLSRPEVRVTQGARLVAQADDAEAWIADLLGGGAGPTGLLWVRQGITALDQQDGAIEARRDLLSSVAGEVEAMTGGRRMDAALRRCREDLARYHTDKGRARTGGPLAEAQKKVEGLTNRRAMLAEQVATMEQALTRRHEVRRHLAELRDPAAVEARQARLIEAAAALTRAERHAEAVEKAAEAVALSGLKLAQTTQALESLRVSRREHSDAARAAKAHGTTRADAEAALIEARARLAEAETAARSAASAATDAARLLNASLRHEAAKEGARRRTELIARIEKAEEAQTSLQQATLRAAIGPTAKQMGRLDELAQAVATARRLQAAQAVKITMSHGPQGAGGVAIDGSALPEGEPIAITSQAVLSLRGLGELMIDPGGQGGTEAEGTDAEAALSSALGQFGYADRDSARVAAQARQMAEGEAHHARATLDVLAPEGVAALRAILSALPEAVTEEDLPSSEAAQQAYDAAEVARQAAEATRETARARVATSRERMARAAAAMEGASERLLRAESALPAGDPAAREIELDGTRATLAGELAAAEARRDELSRAAPDLASARAARDRAQSVIEAARAEAEKLTLEMGQLDTLIDLRASEAVEEELADTEARLAAAEAQLQRVTFEVAVLQRLEAALDAARTQARERYFAPVMAELAPLLRLIWPEADLRFDDATLLPSTLIRAGQEEELDILSGGTQEQIALLVRLAFARMHARAGRAAPLILDDALVFTDDDRIEAMFDALHRQAADLQIIVLTCRQRAFRDLGGNRLTITPTAGGA